MNGAPGPGSTVLFPLVSVLSPFDLVAVNFLQRKTQYDTWEEGLAGTGGLMESLLLSTGRPWPVLIQHPSQPSKCPSCHPLSVPVPRTFSCSQVSGKEDRRGSGGLAFGGGDFWAFAVPGSPTEPRCCPRRPPTEPGSWGQGRAPMEWHPSGQRCVRAAGLPLEQRGLRPDPPPAAPVPPEPWRGIASLVSKEDLGSRHSLGSRHDALWSHGGHCGPSPPPPHLTEVETLPSKEAGLWPE